MKVLFFSNLPSITGCSEATIPAGSGLSTDALWSALESRFPGILQYRPSTRLARNGEYVTEPVVFAENDEVALIPPVSGG